MSDRKVTLRRRPDLLVERHEYQGEVSWVVKDPLALAYFRLQDHDFAALEMLDGSRDLRAIREELERRFAPERWSMSDLEGLLGSFHQCGLVYSTSAGQGEQLLQRRDEWSRGQRSRWGNLLAVRLPGFDPDPMLNFIYPLARWCFHPLSIIAWLLLIAAAIGLIVLRFDGFQARLPEFHQFFAFHNVIWMAAALASSKVLHELGHAFACKHFGRECHEIGLMFLVFTPCLYCDTSDAWLLSSKWKRAAIGLAGVFVELVLAAICTFVWWFSQPGLIHYLSLSVMLVCSVSTVIFNGNPLLRYDGYYVLSDLLEIPNLGQRSRAALAGVMRQWCLGLPWPSEQVLPRRTKLAFALYAIASATYRWVVVVLILWFLLRVFEPYGLQPIGHVLIAIAIYQLAISPLFRLVAFLSVPGRMHKVKPWRLAISLAGATTALAALALAPFPHYVTASVVVEPRGASPVYVTQAGALRRVDVRGGDAVEDRQVLAVLQDTEAALEIARLEGQRNRLDSQLSALRRRQGRDPSAAALIPQTNKALDELDDQLRARREHQKRLTLVSPRKGVVIPPRDVPSPLDDETKLPRWHGSPLTPRNLGAHLQRGALLCWIGDPDLLEAVLIVDQGDLEFVQEGQDVRIKLEEYPDLELTSRVESLSMGNLHEAPSQLSSKAGGELQTLTDPAGVERPMSVVYQAIAPLENTGVRIYHGFRGRAKIYVGRRPLALRFWRFVQESFRPT